MPARVWNVWRSFLLPAAPALVRHKHPPFIHTRRPSLQFVTLSNNSTCSAFPTDLRRPRCKFRQVQGAVFAGSRREPDGLRNNSRRVFGVPCNLRGQVVRRKLPMDGSSALHALCGVMPRIDVSLAAAGEHWNHRFRSTAEQVLGTLTVLQF